MPGLLLLTLVTLLYAGYNLYIKASSSHIPDKVTSSVLATICLQLCSLVPTILLAIYLLKKGGQTLQLNNQAYAWTAAAGLCIGAAEVGYFYLFGTFSSGKSIPASIVIPTVVCRTIIIALVASHLIFGAAISLVQLVGAILAISGVVMIYAGKQTYPCGLLGNNNRLRNCHA